MQQGFARKHTGLAETHGLPCAMALRLIQPAATDEAVVACGVQTKHLGQITPRCSRAQDPEDAIEDTAVVNPTTPRGLFGSMGLNCNLFIIGEFVAHDSNPQFGSLNHRGLARRNFRAGPGWTLTGQKRTSASQQSPLKPSKMTRSGYRFATGRSPERLIIVCYLERGSIYRGV
jgi:hypothetical protein